MTNAKTPRQEGGPLEAPQKARVEGRKEKRMKRSWEWSLVSQAPVALSPVVRSVALLSRGMRSRGWAWSRGVE